MKETTTAQKTFLVLGTLLVVLAVARNFHDFRECRADGGRWVEGQTHLVRMGHGWGTAAGWGHCAPEL